MKRWLLSRGVHFDGTSVAVLCLYFAIVGCGKNDIRVYSVPKETAVAEAGGQPHIRWKLPAGWEEREGDQIRVARFAVTGNAGESADVSIIPLGGLGAAKEQLLNIWREQIHLPQADPTQLTNSANSVAIGSGQGELYEMVSEEAVLDSKKARILVAMLKAEDGLWVFKMSGHADFVERQKPEFASFLKSIAIDKSSATPSPRIASTNAKRTPSASKSGEDTALKPNWTVPAGWQEQPPSQMAMARFLVGAEGGSGKAEVTVTAFDREAGGVLDNVNRWRGQVSLPPLNQSQLDQNVASLDLNGSKAILVDVSGISPRNGQKTRIIGAIVPREGKTWFFKMTGDEQVADKEKTAFVKFVQTVQFPDA